MEPWGTLTAGGRLRTGSAPETGGRGAARKAQPLAWAHGCRAAFSGAIPRTCPPCSFIWKTLSLSKGKTGFMVLESVFFGVEKNLRDFMVQWSFFKKCLRQTTFKKNEILCPNWVDDRVINTATVIEPGAGGFSQMSWISPCAHSSHRYLWGTRYTTGPVLSSGYSCGQNRFCSWGSLVLYLGCTFESPRELWKNSQCQAMSKPMKSESLAVGPSVSIFKNFPGDFIVQWCVRTGSGETSEDMKVCPLNPNGSILSQFTPLDLPTRGRGWVGQGRQWRGWA